MFVIMSSVAFADWGASRSISGNIVTITITPGDGFDTFTVTETLTGATVVAPAPRGCGISGNKLICDFDGLAAGTIVYTTGGSGSVAGSIDGVNSQNLAIAGQTKTITGATAIPSGGSPPAADPCAAVVCTPTTQVCPDGVSVSCTPTCSGGACGSCTPDCSGHASREPSARTTLITALNSALDGAGSKLQKISSIARALRDYFIAIAP